MPFLDSYRQQVRLLIQLLPITAKESCFALKGGTAINLFVRDLPRLSVDIDLMYLPLNGRTKALDEIESALIRIQAAIQGKIPGARVGQHRTGGALTRLIVLSNHARVKIECSPVLRGVVKGSKVMTVTESVESEFGFAQAPVVSFDDLYAGKLVAALDRQHPRDLFDVRGLLEAEGIQRGLRETFLLYLLSHNRPMGEILSGRVKDLAAEYRDGFAGMTQTPIGIHTLIQTQARLIRELIGQMPQHHQEFLLTFEKGAADWSLLGLDGAPKLPAIRWRQHNLDTLDPKRRSELVRLLEHSLSRAQRQ